MKKFLELIRTKEREEKTLQNNKKANEKEVKIEAPAQNHEHAVAPQHDLFWDDYSDVGYC